MRMKTDKACNTARMNEIEKLVYSYRKGDKTFAVDLFSLYTEYANCRLMICSFATYRKARSSDLLLFAFIMESADLLNKAVEEMNNA